MSGAGVNFRGLANGANTVTPVDGEGGFHSLVPISGPLMESAPPVRPVLVERVSTGWDVRMSRARSGHLVTHALDTAPRPPRYRVRWGAMTASQRSSMRAWLATVSTQLLAWPLDVDAADSGEVRVRFTSEPAETFVDRGIFAGEEIEVEEVYG